MPCIPFVSHHGAAAIITRNSPSSIHRPSINVGLHWQLYETPVDATVPINFASTSPRSGTSGAAHL
jgi:hypothetical protein